jgi:O-antigen/teichoic acid export membrane protein
MKKTKKRNKADPEKALPVILSIGASVLSALTSLLIAKPLGSELYGTIQYYVGIIGSLATILPFGLIYVLTKKTQFQEDKKEFLTKHILLFNLLNAISIPIFVLIAYFGLSKLNKNLTVIILLFFSGYATAFDGLIGAYLLGTKRAALSTALKSFIPKMILFVLSICVLYLDGKLKLVEFYIPIYLLSYGISCIPYSISLIKKTSFRFSKGELMDIGAFFLLSVTQGINTYLSRVMQGQYDAVQVSSGNTSYNGIYGLSLQIMALSTLFGSVITTISQPTFAFYSQQNDNKGLINSYRQVLRVNSYIGIPFGFALLIECKPVLSFFGNSYTSNESILFFILVGTSTLLSNITGPDGTLLTYAGHQKLQIINGLVLVGSFLTVSSILFNFSIYGIPIAYLSSTFIVEILKIIEFKHFYKTLPIDKKTGLLLLAILAFCFAAFFPLSLISNKWVWLIANLVVGCVVILLCFVLTPYKEDRLFFKRKQNQNENEIK